MPVTRQRLDTSSTTAKPSWRAGATRIVLFSVLWGALTGGDAKAWGLGVPVIVLVTATSLALWPPSALSWLALVRFLPYFVSRSLLGAVDVAWRAFRADMPLHPGLVEYTLSLPPGIPQVTMANVVSLLPGTLSAELDDHRLMVHGLNIGPDIQTSLADVEQRIGAIFGLSLTAQGHGD